MSPKVLITDYAWPTLEIEQKVLAEIDAELVVSESGEEAELVSLAKDVDAILTCWSRVTGAVLDAADRCVIVSRYGIGLDNIDVERATESGIVVTNVPDYCVDEVSDHTLALVLACARRLVPLANALREGSWDSSAAGPLRRLSGSTLGLVGYGLIARAVAERARAFGLRVVAWTPRLRAGEATVGVEIAASLDDLLTCSDFVSLHCPLTDETAGLIDASALGRMKPTAFLINTARGPIVDEAALTDALDRRVIAGAALDVFEVEPTPPDDPLFACDSLLATPHAAFCSEMAIAELQRRAAEHVVHALRGKEPPHVVNPSVLVRDECRLGRQR